MGNFYTNIVLRDTNADAVAATLGTMKRRAYVAPTARATIVFDERCDAQDVDELERLARELSRRHGPALAICNHDDDVLWYALAADGVAIDRYNSLPSLFDEGTDEPAGGDAARLCEAFGALDTINDVHALLRRRHSDIGVEVDRHVELCRLIGLPLESVGLGYGYVRAGEFSNTGAAPPIAVGGAPKVDAVSGPARAAEGLASDAADWPSGSPAEALVFASNAMLRSEIDVPAPFSSVLGKGRVNGMLAFERLKRYLLANGLLVPGPPAVVRADALVAEMLGVREVPFASLTQLFCDRFHVPPLSPAEQTALLSNDREFLRRQSDAMASVLEQI